MKEQILQILQMERDGKLTQEQAAELLAMLADQARERPSVSMPPEQGAPGPQGAGGGSGSGREERKSGFPANAAVTIQSLVDSAVGLGTTVGRAATVLATEIAQTVHREQAGNTITLSKVEEPRGDRYVFKANSMNVSKVSAITLNDAEFSSNSINASRIAHVEVTRGRFSQNDIAGSSLHQIQIEGVAATDGAPADPGSLTLATASNGLPLGLLRGATFNASKVARVKILAGSALDACMVMTSVVKDLELTGRSVLRDSKVIDSVMHDTKVGESTLANLAIERTQMQGLVVKESTLEKVGLHSTRADNLTILHSSLVNTRFRRFALGSGVGSRESLITEMTIDQCTLRDCDFLGCTFRRTTFRNLNLSGLTVRNVDFTGMTLESDEAFRKAAGYS